MFKQLINQAISAERCYQQTGNLSAVDKSIAAWERILRHPELTEKIRLEVLNHRLAACQRAVQLTPAGSPDLPGRLYNLGNGWRDCYVRTGALIDLQAGIKEYQRAVQLTPTDSSDLPIYLNNLGTGFHDRYTRTNDLTDLQAGIMAYQRAVQLTPKDSPNLPIFLHNLELALKDRPTHRDNLSDLPVRMEAKTIMVVDDSPTTRKVVKILLKKQGMEVLTAEDGVDAVAQLQGQVPDLILLDEEIPQMDGYELATQIRNTPEWKHLPLIMITTSPTGAKHRDRAEKIGIDRYFGKPFNRTELFENVNALLNERGSTSPAKASSPKPRAGLSV